MAGLISAWGGQRVARAGGSYHPALVGGLCICGRYRTGFRLPLNDCGRAVWAVPASNVTQPRLRSGFLF